MPELIVTTSWDDGTKADLKMADSLEKFNLKGKFYICCPQLPKPSSLLEDQDMFELDKRFEVGAHTISHPDLVKIPLSQALHEIGGSKTYLENLLGHYIDMFSYPYGSSNQAVRRCVNEAGFIAARTIHCMGFNFPEDLYNWHVSMPTQNVPPMTNWEHQGKSLFDQALDQGGVFHIYGHSALVLRDGLWDMLERLFEHVLNRKDVMYISHGEIFTKDVAVRGSIGLRPVKPPS